jgi:uncharacterized membrane protein
MESYIIEWLSLLGRWAHMIFGIAWVGASFYFIWLDNHLQRPLQQHDADKGVSGELWAVHGGGFYHSQKYQVAPETLPGTLHWFKWEAYTTWLSGMFLMVLMYWYQAEIYLIDPSVADLSKPAAIIIGVATLVIGWLVYDWLCKSSIASNEAAMAAVLLVFLTVVAFVLCQLFSGRGAYIHFGAMLGTMMVGNVAHVIIPGQRDLVAAKQEGREPDPIHGINGKLRSVHNTYFTLPVLFVMISNHYAMTYGHQYNWLILIALSVAGALIRVYFVKRHFGRASLVPVIVAGLLLAGIAWAIAPKPVVVGDAEVSSEALFAQAQSVVQARCSSCHAQVPTQAGFTAAPKGVLLETPEQLLAQADTIHQQTVVTRAMPIGNLTGITEEERAVLARWFATLQQ